MRRRTAAPAPPLSAAAHYHLMTGIAPNCHECGEVDYQTWRCEADHTLPPCVSVKPIPGGFAWLLATEGEQRALWAAHREALTVEAKRYGFAPAAENWTAGDDLQPRDLAVTAGWRREFLERFGGRSVRTFESENETVVEESDEHF